MDVAKKASVELWRAAIDDWRNCGQGRKSAAVGCGGRRTLLATEVIFSVLICLCVMSGYQTLPVAGSVSCLQNPLLAKSRGLCASFSALCGFEVAARLNLSLIMTAEVCDDVDRPNIASACPSLVVIYFAVYM